MKYLTYSRGTRGRILGLLRRRARTVDELARELALTGNAVRAHLAALERDGLVRPTGVRRAGPGKPPQVYVLAPEAETLFFSSACAPLLAQFLGAARARLQPAQVGRLMRSAGRGLAAAHGTAAGEPRARVEAAARHLDALGGVMSVRREDGGLVVRGEVCPVAPLTADHPEVCRAIESYVAAVTGLTVRQRCRRQGGLPRCTLLVTPPAVRRRR